MAPLRVEREEFTSRVEEWCGEILGEAISVALLPDRPRTFQRILKLSILNLALARTYVVAQSAVDEWTTRAPQKLQPAWNRPKFVGR